MEFDPLAFQGTAEYYAIGRPPYAERLADTLTRELGLDGTGQLLDVGCGPGVLVLRLAGLFERVVGLDSEVGMLREGERRCRDADIENVRWVLGVAEDLAALDVRECRTVTFGQSFHRVRRAEVAEIVYDLLEPGGSLVLISHAVDGRPRPVGPDLPTIPHDEIRELIASFVGDDCPSPLRHVEGGAAGTLRGHLARDPVRRLTHDLRDRTNGPRARHRDRRGVLLLHVVRHASTVRRPPRRVRRAATSTARRAFRERTLLGLAGGHRTRDRDEASLSVRRFVNSGPRSSRTSGRRTHVNALSPQRRRQRGVGLGSRAAVRFRSPA